MAKKVKERPKCFVCQRPMGRNEIGDESPEERVCDDCAEKAEVKVVRCSWCKGVLGKAWVEGSTHYGNAVCEKAQAVHSKKHGFSIYQEV